MQRWGRWREVKELGEGTFGRVYHVQTDQPIEIGSFRANRAALKVINQDSGISEDHLKKILVDELEILYKLSHEKIVRLFEADITSRVPWVAMQYLVGEPLYKEISGEGPLADEAWLDLAADIFDAISYTESMNVIHHDLHIANVMRSTKGTFLIDFGLAMRVQPNMHKVVAGIPYYIAPEGFDNSSNWTTRMDVFSAGCVLYFAATGIHPFWRDSDPRQMNDFPTVRERMLRKECDYSLLTKLQLSLIGQMHELDPKRRVSASSMLEQILEAKRSFNSNPKEIRFKTSREKFATYYKNQRDKRQAKVNAYSKRIPSLQLKRDLVRDILDEITIWSGQKQRHSFVVTTQVGMSKATFEYYKRSTNSVLVLQIEKPLEEAITRNLERTGWVDLTGERTQFEVIFDKNKPDSSAAMRIANTLIITLDLGVEAFANLLISPRVLR